MSKKPYVRPVFLFLGGAVLISLLAALGASSIIILNIRRSADLHTYTSVDTVPPDHVAIVFGASVHHHALSDVLHDRVQTGIALYQKGKVRKLLMSGDNRYLNYNEPMAMKKYAMLQGIPARDIVLDYAGRSTYDTCYRAKAIFGLDSAILVTQSYHLPRALYLARSMGIDAVGVRAEQQAYRGQPYFSLREQVALLYNWVKINFIKPVPILGDPLPIEVEGAPTQINANSLDE
ncbi:MAG: YdcF family protein [Acidobacteria bacterium]|nr:YdcF family protein [Acidobacteriota bacterium]MBI3655734.1 YdcF family protein [Acidobacteriota bacterium]